MNTALISIFLWTLFVFYCPYTVWTARVEDTALLEVKAKLMLSDVMDRVRRIESDMEVTVAEMKMKDMRIGSLEFEMKTKDERIAALENKMTAKEEEMTSLRGRMTETEQTELELREMVDQVRNPPFAFQCAWQDRWTTENSIITYDRLTYDDISGGDITEAAGGMDISNGVFTVGRGFSGVWSITFSTFSYSRNTNRNNVFLYLNGQRIDESEYFAYNENSGLVGSFGGRTLYMRLEEGDQVTLRGYTEVYHLHHITICFELAQFD